MPVSVPLGIIGLNQNTNFNPTSRFNPTTNRGHVADTAMRYS
jgi:hypothetical protein